MTNATGSLLIQDLHLTVPPIPLNSTAQPEELSKNIDFSALNPFKSAGASTGNLADMSDVAEDGRVELDTPVEMGQIPDNADGLRMLSAENNGLEVGVYWTDGHLTVSGLLVNPFREFT